MSVLIEKEVAIKTWRFPPGIALHPAPTSASHLCLSQVTSADGIPFPSHSLGFFSSGFAASSCSSLTDFLGLAPNPELLVG